MRQGAGGGVGKKQTFQSLSSPPQGHQDAGLYVLAHIQRQDFFFSCSLCGDAVKGLARYGLSSCLAG